MSGTGADPARNRHDWIVLGLAAVATEVVVCAALWLVGGTDALVLGFTCVTAGILAAAWYTVSGRTMDSASEVRERTVERHYVGVAWYASMLRTATARGGYERGLRAELTRLTAVRLAERRDINMYRAPEDALRVIGPELWPLVDPRIVVRPGQDPPAIPPRAVLALVDLLEQL